MREHLALQTHLSAMEAFNDWFDHFHKGQPVRPVLAEGASFTEKVAHEQRERVYQGDMERWRGPRPGWCIDSLKESCYFTQCCILNFFRLSKVDKLKKGSELCWRFLEAGWLKMREKKMWPWRWKASPIKSAKQSWSP